LQSIIRSLFAAAEGAEDAEEIVRAALLEAEFGDEVRNNVLGRRMRFDIGNECSDRGAKCRGEIGAVCFANTAADCHGRREPWGRAARAEA
jgi:hypothetical protein